MHEIFYYTCPHCGEETPVNADPIPEKIVCFSCEKEIEIGWETFFSGEVFAGEFL